MTGDTAFTTSIVTTIEEFHSLAPAWNDLHAAAGPALPFLRHDWLAAWWAHFGKDRRPAVVTVREGDRLAAALPLYRDHHKIGVLSLRSLESWSNDHSFRFEPLCRAASPGAPEALWDAVRAVEGGWDLLLLRDVALAEADVARDAISTSAARDGHPTGTWRSYESPFLALDGTWEGFLAGLPGKFRYNLRARAKKLDAEGSVAFEVVRDRDVTESMLDDCFAVERRSWKGEEGSAIACDPNLVSFYRRVASDAAARGALRLHLLRVGDRLAAFDLSLEEGDRYYCLKIGYDPDFTRFGAGQLLNARILEGCFARGVRTYEFLGPLTEAKDAWQPARHRHVWIYVFGRGPVPRAAHAMKFTLREALKRQVSE